jgi:hypothetical protein
MTIDAFALLVSRVGERELAIERVIAHGEGEGPRHRVCDVAELGSRVTRGTLPVHPLAHMMTRSAIGGALNETNAMARLHGVAIHARELRVPVVPER